MSQDHRRHIVSNPTTRVKVKGWALCGISSKSPKHYFGPQMRGLIGSPPSPAAPQLRMASSNLAMTHLSFEKRAPTPCEHICVPGQLAEKGPFSFYTGTQRRKAVQFSHRLQHVGCVCGNINRFRHPARF